MIWLIWILASVVAALFFAVGRQRDELSEVRQMAIQSLQNSMDLQRQLDELKNSSTPG